MPNEVVPPYAAEVVAENVDQCFFYHTADLPGHGVQVGQWDLRGRETEYCGGFPFAGKRVLEFGTANGGLAFWMERQGAEVVGFDLSPAQSWDLVPFAGVNYAAEIERRRELIGRLNRAWWFSRRVHGATARVVYGNLYAVPPSIGAVDVATFGSILLHVRDPFLALQNGAALAREAVIVTDVMPPADPDLRRRWQRAARRVLPARVLERLLPPAPRTRPAQQFLPDPVSGEPNDTWWYLHPDGIVRMLGVLGFGQATVTYHQQRFKEDNVKLFTVVARRTQGTVAVPPTSRMADA